MRYFRNLLVDDDVYRQQKYKDTNALVQNKTIVKDSNMATVAQWLPLVGYEKEYEINDQSWNIRHIFTKRIVKISSNGRMQLAGKWVHMANVVFDHRQLQRIDNQTQNNNIDNNCEEKYKSTDSLCDGITHPNNFVPVSMMLKVGIGFVIICLIMQFESFNKSFLQIKTAFRFY